MFKNFDRVVKNGRVLGLLVAVSLKKITSQFEIAFCDEAAFADGHCIFLWAGIANLAESEISELFWKPENLEVRKSIFWKVRKSRFGKVGTSIILEVGGNPEVCKSEVQKFGIQTIQYIRILKIKIPVAQTVGKVGIRRNEIIPAPFHAI